MKFYYTILILLLVSLTSYGQAYSIGVSDSIFLSGSLVDRGGDEVVVMIAGSGPTDRNCNNTAGLKTDAFKMLAYSLAGQGISSFRYDKRGIGKSTKMEESTMTIHDFIDDASVIVDTLSNKYSNIVLLGHSEGAVIGSVVAGENKNVKSFISVSGVSEPLDKIVLRQIQKYPLLVPLAEKHIHEIKNDEPLSEVNPMLVSLFRDSVVPFLKSVFEKDPIEAFSNINKPILTVGGSCDIQVLASHAHALHESNKNSELLLINDMGHTMKKLKPDCSDNMDSYSDPNMDIHQELVDGIIDFIRN